MHDSRCTGRVRHREIAPRNGESSRSLGELIIPAGIFDRSNARLSRPIIAVIPSSSALIDGGVRERRQIMPDNRSVLPWITARNSQISADDRR